MVGGGGLGIMEAANLGAYLAERTAAERDDAVDALAAAPPWTTDPAGYMAVADAIRDLYAPGGAGTMQEIFQDAAQNAYRTFGRSPLAFLDARQYRDYRS